MVSKVIQKSRIDLRLPGFINNANKYWLGAVILVVNGLLYSLTNKLMAASAIALPMTNFDLSVGLETSMVWIYLSYPLLFVWTYHTEKDSRQLSRYLYAALAVNLLSNLVFLFFPTSLDRSAFPLPGDGSLSTAVLSWVRSYDQASNCCPSLHVSTSLLTALFTLGRGKRRFTFAMIWAVAICLSTMFTKQHYLADVLGGALAALGAYYLFFLRIKVGSKES